jgi:hypothetical protein
MSELLSYNSFTYAKPSNLVFMVFRRTYLRESASVTMFFFFFGKLTYVLKEEDTKIIRGIPQIYNENRNIKTTDGYRLATEQKTETSLDSLGKPIQPANYQIKNLCY